MKSPILHVEALESHAFTGVSFLLAPDAWLRLAGGPQTACEAFVDTILGINAAAAGDVIWHGISLTQMSESECFDIAGRHACVHQRGGLILNLRVWENLLLPLQHHQKKFDIDDVETRIITAYSKAGIPQEEAARILQSRSDDLTQHEVILSQLIRADLLNPLILVCQNLFDSLPARTLQATCDLLGWIALQNPGLALLTVGDSPATLANMDLDPWPAPQTITWNETSWQNS